jgi:hypothetical protein
VGYHARGRVECEAMGGQHGSGLPKVCCWCQFPVFFSFCLVAWGCWRLGVFEGVYGGGSVRGKCLLCINGSYCPRLPNMGCIVRRSGIGEVNLVPSNVRD